MKLGISSLGVFVTVGLSLAACSGSDNGAEPAMTATAGGTGSATGTDGTGGGTSTSSGSPSTTGQGTPTTGASTSNTTGGPTTGSATTTTGTTGNDTTATSSGNTTTGRTTGSMTDGTTGTTTTGGRGNGSSGGSTATGGGTTTAGRDAGSTNGTTGGRRGTTTGATTGSTTGTATTTGGDAGAPGTMASVAALLQSRCVTCHDTMGMHSSHIDLRSAGLHDRLVGKTYTGSDMCGGNGTPLVTANNPAMSLLALKVQTNPPCGNRMPNMCSGNGNMACLTAAQIQIITAWINAGAPP